MSNMPYCRFQNTVRDLRDCAYNMDDRELSYEEVRARYQLIKICGAVAANYLHETEKKIPTREQVQRGEW